MKRTGPDALTREQVAIRDRYRCVICTAAFRLQLHHRRPRGAGGTRRADANSPSNLLLLCADCHSSVESYRQDAMDNGWLLSQTADPTASPVRWHDNRTVLLLPDGTVEDVTPEWHP